MTAILIVEDEPAIADTLVYALQTENFSVTHVETAQGALDHLERETPGFFILDVGLPDLSGFDLCKKIRQNHQTPILFLTARDSEIDQILGLELGADDYVTKPFSPRAVVARVRAILRRQDFSQTQTPEDAPTNPVFPLLAHHSESMQITCLEKSLNLTAHEYKLLAVLLKQPGRVFSRDQLLMQAWEDPGSAMDRTIDAHIKSLRAKLREISPAAAEALQTRRGLGYVLQLSSP